MGPHLGILEPPRWLGRVGMVFMVALALHGDYNNGVLHDFMAPPSNVAAIEVPAAQSADESFFFRHGLSGNLLTDMSLLTDVPISL